MQRYQTTVLLVVAIVLCAAPVSAQWSASRADSHAPIGVMGDHRHEAGEIMVSHRFMDMRMKGSRDGTDAIDDADIIAPNGYGSHHAHGHVPGTVDLLPGITCLGQVDDGSWGATSKAKTRRPV